VGPVKARKNEKVEGEGQTTKKEEDDKEGHDVKSS